MFIEKITIYNLLVYYGKSEINFSPANDKANDKNVYCIYGENGFGKTSFMTCCKLLFIGGGLLDSKEMARLPKALEKICGNVKFSSPKGFMEGNKHWGGIFNKAAQNEAQNVYYIQFEGRIKDKKFRLKREWNKYVQGNEITEILEYQLGNRFYENEDAQYEINKILSPKFVDFFFFNGEEIEHLSENLRTSLKEKITAILQITPLEIIIKQIEKIKAELRNNQLENTQEKNKYDENTQELTLLNTKLNNANKEIEQLQNMINEKKQEYDLLNKNTINSMQKFNELESKMQELQERLKSAKIELPNMLQDLPFIANKEILEIIKNDIMESNPKKINKIEIFAECLEQAKPLIQDLAKPDSKAYKILENWLDSIPQKLSQRILPARTFPLNTLDSINSINNQIETQIIHIKNIKENIKNTQKEMQELNINENTKQDSIHKEITHLRNNIESLKHKLDSKKDERALLKNNIESLQSKLHTKPQIATNLQYKITFLDSIKSRIIKRKNNLINDLRNKLHAQILKNYKTLAPDDNVNDLEINDEFEIILKNIRNDTIQIISQSSGQKQILAMAIFWAISSISNSKVPLIIDTPLGRIDGENRERIIKNYYANSKTQVIILSTDTEVAIKEYEYIKPNVATIYRINNTPDREHATIIESNIKDILQY